MSLWSSQQHIYGPRHPNVGVALGNLARVYEDRGDRASALRLRREALAIHLEAEGPDAPNTKLAQKALDEHVATAAAGTQGAAAPR